jgi:uncharacterized protein (DUF885 family)
MEMRKVFVRATLIALVASAPAYADAGDELKSLVDTYWADVLKEAPVFASSLGVDTYANEVGDYSLAASDRRAASAAKFLKQLEAITQADRLKEPLKAMALVNVASTSPHIPAGTRILPGWQIIWRSKPRRTLKATIIG